MRTSASQFELLVDFMQRNGDLSKPSGGSQGRLTNMQRWSELTNILNADATGDTKTTIKWKKVWSDLKNNIKKKVARIHRASQGTGGGPPSTLSLTDLEQRVLNIIGTQAATGIIEIPEVGLDQAEIIPSGEAQTFEVLVEVPTEIPEEEGGSTLEEWNQPGTSAQPTVFPPLHVVDNNQAGAASADSVRADYTAQAANNVPTPPARSTPAPVNTRQHAPQSPTPLPATPRRRRRRILQDASSPIRRTRAQTQSDLARQAFVRSDCEWRAFQQETERERIRLRELELRQQERWLDILSQFVVLGNRIVDLLEKK